MRKEIEETQKFSPRFRVREKYEKKEIPKTDNREGIKKIEKEENKKFSPRFKVREKDENIQIPKTDKIEAIRREPFKKEIKKEPENKGIRDRYLDKNREEDNLVQNHKKLIYFQKI